MPAPKPNGKKRDSNQFVSVRRKDLPKVDDLAALLARVEAYASGGSVGRSTQREYEALWGVWERHCAEGSWEPLSAPLEAFEALWTVRRRDGRRASVAYIDCIVGAIVDRYKRERLPLPHRQPANAGAWRQLRQGYIRSVEQVTRVKEGTAPVPMRREGALALLTARLAWTPEYLACRARNLLFFDLMPQSLVYRLSANDVKEVKNGGVAVFGFTFPCDHRERVQGVPWDCTACSLREAVAHHPGDQPLMSHYRVSTAHYAVMGLRKRFRDMTPATRVGQTQSRTAGPRPGLTDWELAGLRRGMVLYAFGTDGSATPGLRWLRARAWASVAWSAGLRMASDTQRLTRAHVRPDASGRGWSLALAQTKDDPFGARGVVRAFPWSENDSPSVAQMLAEYVCVRDAVAGPDTAGPLLLRWLDPGLFISDMHGAASGDLLFLSELAGVAPAWTTYSTRKGYAAQGVDDGWQLEKIQEGMRHDSVSSTLLYIPEQAAQQVQSKFIAAIAEKGAA